MIDAKSLWCESAGSVGFRSEKLPLLEEGQVFVRAMFSGISRGTEATVFQGSVPKSEFERMRAPHMVGSFPFPVKYGYSSVGMVEQGTGNLPSGTKVFCLYPHQDVYAIATQDLIEIPADVPDGRAILAANMETALNICWDAGITIGDKVAVFGCGVVGLAVSFLASQIPGVECVVIDTNEAREKTARHLGVEFNRPDRLAGEFDVLINVSGAATALAQCLDHAGLEARIVEASWYGQREVSITLGGAFHSRRLKVVSSQVGQVSPSQRPRWSYVRRLNKALSLLRDDRLDALISGETLFNDLHDHYGRILTEPSTLCHRVCY